MGLRYFRQIIQRFGFGWVLFRIFYVFRLRSGLMQLQLTSRWRRAQGQITYQSGPLPRFFFDSPPDVSQIIGPESVLAEADMIMAGKWPYFSQNHYTVGFPPDWHTDPTTGRHWPSEKHWSRIGDFDFGDVKLIWEASRFTVVFALARAYAISHDEHCAVAFWQLVEDWRTNNPPFLGANWKCGQETAFRAIALIFGLYVFQESPHSTGERITTLRSLLAVHGVRIASNIRYGLSQHNNHSVSEGVGLWTLGLVCTGFSESVQWRIRGKRIVESELLRQIATDGSHYQYSANYARLILDCAVWAIALGTLNGDPIAAYVIDRVSALTDYLYNITDPATGQTPNYGANDGAQLLPLTGCDYSDFRPTLQLAYALIHSGARLYEHGPWDESLAWILGDNAPPSTVNTGNRPNSAKNTLERGIHRIQSNHSCAYLYTARYRVRPGHADQLHFDLWWRGVNIALDAGTYRYNADPPWNNALSRTSVHNTVTVNDRDQMTRAGRFLWLDWADVTVNALHTENNGRLVAIEAQHNGYAPIIHRRTVTEIGTDRWQVTDHLTGNDHNVHYQLHWLLVDAPYTWDQTSGQLTLYFSNTSYTIQCEVLTANTDDYRSVIRADPNSTRGWQSRYYDHKAPVLSLMIRVLAPSVIFRTTFGPASE